MATKRTQPAKRRTSLEGGRKRDLVGLVVGDEYFALRDFAEED